MLSSPDRAVGVSGFYPPGTWTRTPSGRLPLIVFGDSDAASTYVPNSEADSTVQGPQFDQEYAYRISCLQGHGVLQTWLANDAIGPLAPVMGSGIWRTNYWMDLGYALARLGIRVTIIHFAVGGSTLDDYSPTLNPPNYAIRLAWVKAMLGNMQAPLVPILITDQGMAGPGTPVWHVAQAALNAQLTTDLGLAQPLRTCLIRAPYTAGYTSFGEYHFLYDDQNYYASVTSRCRIAVNDAMTYIDDNTLVPGNIHGIHFDGPSARKLAIGPDDSNTVSIVTALQQLIALG